MLGHSGGQGKAAVSGRVRAFLPAFIWLPKLCAPEISLQLSLHRTEVFPSLVRWYGVEGHSFQSFGEGAIRAKGQSMTALREAVAKLLARRLRAYVSTEYNLGIVVPWRCGNRKLWGVR
jgi:hypothetical protein